MKVLITGMTGMVGSHLVDFLVENTDWEIHGMIRWRSPLDNLRNHLPMINKKERIFLHYGDLKDAQSLDKIVADVRPDYVFHLAAQSFPRTSFDAPIDTYDTNILGTSRLMEALHKYAPNAVVHNCSSSEVFGRVPKELIPINENCNFHPASPYAISKVGTDMVGRFYAEAYGLNVVTTRMFTHTGPRRGDVFAESSFAKQIALIEAGVIDPVIKVGNLKSLRTVADVRDAVRAYYMLVTISPKAGEVYNIGGEHSCTVGEILNDLLSLSSMKDAISVVEDPERLRPIDADLQVPDTAKFRKYTGWEPKIPYTKTIMDLLNYWREEVSRDSKHQLVR